MRATDITFRTLAAGILLCLGMISSASADVYINVMAVNGADTPKNSSIRFGLPGELTAEDVLDTNGLRMDYNVDDGDYYVYGDVNLAAKESKTFRIRVKDKWMITTDRLADLKKQIDQGYATLGKPHDAAKADLLKDRLDKRVDYIFGLQSTNGASVEKRIGDFRIYSNELKRLQNEALDVSYWRSDPGAEEHPKLIHLTIEANNTSQNTKHFKHKDYLPEEVKPEDVVEPDTFEVRFDQVKQAPFLFKEEDLAGGEKKKYSIGILDIWTVDQRKIDYLRSRADHASGILKDTRFEESAKILMERITANLKAIEASQAVQRPILDHISVFRTDSITYNETKEDVETLEKLLATFREDLEKSKVENVLRKIQGLKAFSDVSKVMFDKKFATSTAWGFLGWTMLFVGIVTVAGFGMAVIRSREKKISDSQAAEKTDT